MTDSNSWLTQDQYDAAADEALAAGGVTLETLKPNQVARRLGKKNANPTIYKYHQDWRDRREGGRSGAPMYLPADASERLENVLDRFKAEFMAAALVTMGEIARASDQRANMRVASSEHSAAEARIQKEQMLEDWSVESALLAAADARVIELTQALDDARLAIAKLEGRLEQATADRQAALGTTPDRESDDDHGDAHVIDVVDASSDAIADPTDAVDASDVGEPENDDDFRPF